MAKLHIYASMVANLTDARYFAAKGVDVIGFDMDSRLTASELKTMVDWVEGPLFVAESSNTFVSNSDIESWLESGVKKIAMPEYSMVDTSFPTIMKYQFIPDIEIASPSILHLDLPFDQWNPSLIEQIKQTIAGKDCYLDMPLSPLHIPSIISAVDPFGFIVKGGEEEKTGIKAFDHLDDLFDVFESISE